MPQLLGCLEEEIRLGRDLFQGKRVLQERQPWILLEFVDDFEQFDDPGQHRLILERLVEFGGSKHTRTRPGGCSSCSSGLLQLSRSTLSLSDPLT